MGLCANSSFAACEIGICVLVEKCVREEGHCAGLWVYGLQVGKWGIPGKGV
jgi:hypothetical protein